jgi:dephospho-CoA kinase
MKIVGLTGSIAMGKTTVAKMFADKGLPVFDSDAAVHDLYQRGGEAASAISTLVPEAIVEGAVDRGKLSIQIQKRPELLKDIEALVHPLVQKAQKQFLLRAANAGARLAVLDMPLLFETGRDNDVDIIILVSANGEIQKERAMRRPGMSEEKLQFLLSRQLSDADKRARADYVIDNSGAIKDLEFQVDLILKKITQETNHA